MKHRNIIPGEMGELRREAAGWKTVADAAYYETEALRIERDALASGEALRQAWERAARAEAELSPASALLLRLVRLHGPSPYKPGDDFMEQAEAAVREAELLAREASRAA